MKKKLLFWITIDFKQFFVANYFQKFEDYELYAIVDCPSNTKNFFKNQQLVKFKKFGFYMNKFKTQQIFLLKI